VLWESRKSLLYDTKISYSHHLMIADQVVRKGRVAISGENVLDVQRAASSRSVAVIGSGYVGLTLSASLALLGHGVECTDRLPGRVAELSGGRVPIVEEGLTALVRRMLDAGRLRFETSNARAAGRAEFVFLCLPTPSDADGRADLSFVRAVAVEIGPVLRPGATVITKSTVPVGTGETLERAIDRDDVHVVANPEFLAEGTAVMDCLYPDRIVIGARSDDVARNVADLYGSAGHSRLILTDLASAELIKYASNAYLATRLTFVNAMAGICEAAGADIRSVMAGMGSDHRIGAAFLQPGPGWGGSCLPKDTQALADTAKRLGCDLALIEAVIAGNAHHKRRVVEKVTAALDDDIRGKRIAIWGLTFKAGTDDLRDSPALDIAQCLGELDASVQAYDPTVPAGTLRGIEVHSSAMSAARDADALIITTEWPEFASADLAALAVAMSGRVLIDTRNLLDPAAAASEGFAYSGTGTPAFGTRSREVAA
jgi:UDPglucose 6-dehydrogenase